MKTSIDISHIIGWRGNLTGIERVEYHLIKHYFENTKAEFFYWSERAGRFEVASRKFVKKAVINRQSRQEQSGRIAKPARWRRPRKFQPQGTAVILAGLWDNSVYISSLEKMAGNCDLVHVVYDMIPLTHRDYVVDFLPPVFENYMLSILPKCRKILAISESTAKDTKKILKQAKLPVPPTKSFRLGDDLSRADKAIRPKGIDGSFILSVGTIEARKNHQLLFELQKLLAEEGQPVTPIVIAGKRGWLTDELQAKVADSAHKLVILDKTTDEELRWLYENCLFTIFPSIYEGWGLPVAESLNYGKVTLSSNTSSMPEVGGQFADYFSPTNPAELAALVLKYLDPKARASREQYIKRHYRPLSWDQAAAHFARLVTER